MHILERIQKLTIGLAFVGAVALPLTFPALASAQRGTDDTVSSTLPPTTTNETETEHTTTTTKTTAAEKRTELADRLETTKLKVCQNRESRIGATMERIATRGQKQLDLFTTIADRTEAFYKEKGHTLSNYDALVADVNAKKDAAQTKLDAIKATKVEFKCDGSDPKGAGASFKAALTAEIAALKDYKTAVRNLIVGVKSVQGTTQSATHNTTETKTTQGAQ